MLPLVSYAETYADVQLHDYDYDIGFNVTFFQWEFRDRNVPNYKFLIYITVAWSNFYSISYRNCNWQFDFGTGCSNGSNT